MDGKSFLEMLSPPEKIQESSQANCITTTRNFIVELEGLLDTEEEAQL